MILEPSRLPAVPLLELTPASGTGVPEAPGFDLTLRPDMQWIADRPIDTAVRLTAEAWTRHRHGPLQPVFWLRDEVELPPGANPRTMTWAAELRQRSPEATPRELVDQVLRHIREGGYTYTLTPGVYEGTHPVDEFWLDRRLGFCEHFASAFVVVMRALDIPARIVTGYQGADPVPVDGWVIVRNSNAHAWTEVWIEGEGWVRVDPTGAVAPDRIRLGRSLVPPPGLVAGTLGSVNPELAATLRGWWERLDQQWTQWVLNYSRTRQFDLLRGLGVEAPSWHDLAYVLIGLLSAVSLGGAGWALWDRHRQDPWQRLQRRVAERLARLGVTVAPHEPPRTRAARVRAALGEVGEAVAAVLDRLDAERYGQSGRHRPGAAWWREFSAAAAGVSRRA